MLSAAKTPTISTTVMKSAKEVTFLRVLVALMGATIMIVVASGDSQTSGVNPRLPISTEAAEQIAVKPMPGAVVQRTTLVERSGRKAYQVEVDSQGKDVEVLIDAQDGTVLRTEMHLLMYARLDSDNTAERYQQ